MKLSATVFCCDAEVSRFEQQIEVKLVIFTVQPRLCHVSPLIVWSTTMELEGRIAALENRCRRLAMLATVGLMTPIVLLIVGATADPEPQQFEELIIVDSAGNPRIELGPADAGYGIVIRDSDGDFRATLTDAPGGAVMQLRKAGGDIRLMAMDDAAGLSIRDADGRPRAVISAAERDSQMQIRDAAQTILFDLNDD